MSSKRKQKKSLYVTARIPQKKHRSKGAFGVTFVRFARMYGEELVAAVARAVAPDHRASAKLRRTMRKFVGFATSLRQAARMAKKKNTTVGFTLVVGDKLAVFAPLAPKALNLTHRRAKKSVA